MADAGFGQFVGGMVGGTGGGAIGKTLEYLGIGLGVLIICGLILWYFQSKKQWNLKVEFKLPRSDGRFKDAEWGKGSFNARKGVVYLKRKGMKKVPMKPFDIQRYLQGVNILTVIQTGPDTYEPMLPESYDEMIDDKSGERCVMISFKVDSTESKAWKNSFERDAKSTYRISNWLKDNGGLVAIGLVIFLWGIQFLVLYQKIH